MYDKHRAVEVPLGNSDQKVLIDREGLERAHAAGLTGSWFLNSNGNGNLYVRASDQRLVGFTVTVARVAAGAGAKEIIRHRNGNRLDLRASNLVIVSGKSTGRRLIADVPTTERETE